MDELSQWLAGLPLPALLGLLVLAGVQLVLQVTAIWDVVRRWRAFKGRAWIWLVIILAGNLVGAVLYLALGRPMAKQSHLTDDGGPTDASGAAKRAVDRLYGPGERK